MPEEKNHAEERIAEMVEITPDFTSALQFAMLTRRGSMIKLWQKRLDELTDQNLVDLLEVVAITLDLLGDKEAEVNLLREGYEIAEESYEAMEETIATMQAKLAENRKAMAEQRQWAEETVERRRKEGQS